MSQRFVYADPHFYHENIITYENRPFKDANEMNQIIINNHNKVIKKRDKVFILGDFALTSKEKTIDTVKQLNGYKILIMGNHDKSRSFTFWQLAGFQEVYRYPIIIGNNVILSHEPIYDIDTNLSMYINIHGHIHSKTTLQPPHINVSLDVIDFKPVNLDEIIKKYKKT